MQDYNGNVIFENFEKKRFNKDSIYQYEFTMSYLVDNVNVNDFASFDTNIDFNYDTVSNKFIMNDKVSVHELTRYISLNRNNILESMIDIIESDEKFIKNRHQYRNHIQACEAIYTTSHIHLLEYDKRFKVDLNANNYPYLVRVHKEDFNNKCHSYDSNFFFKTNVVAKDTDIEHLNAKYTFKSAIRLRTNAVIEQSTVQNTQPQTEQTVPKELSFNLVNGKYTNKLCYTILTQTGNPPKTVYRFNADIIMLIDNDATNRYIIGVPHIDFTYNNGVYNLNCVFMKDVFSMFQVDINHKTYIEDIIESFEYNDETILQAKQIKLKQITMDSMIAKGLDLNANHYPNFFRYVISPNNKANHHECYFLCKNNLPEVNTNGKIGVASFISNVTVLNTMK